MPTQWTLAAVLAILFAVAVFLAKQFLGEGAKHLGQRFWPHVFRGRRRMLGKRDLRRYAGGVARTYNNHALGFLANTKVTVSDVYVPLQREVDGRREDIYGSIRTKTRMVVLGAAGAGKSMLLKNSMVKWANEPGAFDRVPVFVELFRRNRGDDSLSDLVADALARGGVKKPERFLERALEDGRLSVFFDGFDEIVTDRKAEVTQQLKQFAEKWPNCQIVVTCRDAVYDFDLRPDFDDEVRVAGFDDAAIRRFLGLWFKSKQLDDARYEVEQMMAGLRASPAIMRLARTPLLLTMIASLHDADPGLGPMLPSSRTEFYEMAVMHLLRRDSQLGRSRELAIYKAGHKLMALRAIAVQAQGAIAPGTDRRTVSEGELLTNITRVLGRFNLEAAHAPRMLVEIVDRSGLLVKVDEGNLLYEFPHLTLQEYLAAMELADSPERLLELYSGNPGRWRETVKLWCGGANRDCTPVVEQIFAGDERGKLLALECLAEARQIDEKLAEKVLDHFEPTLGREEAADHLVVAALGAVAADPGPRGTALLSRLRQAATDHGDLAIEALAASRLRSAVETLSDLARELPAARIALRTTGELAIPVLAERARAGWLWAVDDIAAVGTASAALALVDLLSDDGVAAIRAAWRLAALVNNPDIEEELYRSEPGAVSGARHDWLWVPFNRDGPQAINEIMGRVGFLIDEFGAAHMPDELGVIDPRLAMPIGVIGASRDYLATGTATLDWDVRELARSVGFPVKEYHNNVLVLARVYEENPDAARVGLGKVLDQNQLTPPYRTLLDTLPTPILLSLASRFTLADFRADQHQWMAVTENPRKPVFLRPLAWGALTLLLLGPYGVGVTRATGTAFGWWPWGPPWLGWITMIAAAVAVVSLGSGMVVYDLDWLGDLLDTISPSDDGEGLAFLTATTGLVISLPGAAVLSWTSLTGWIGAPMVLTALAALAAATAALHWIVVRRDRKIANPFRELRKLDESIIRVRSTVISGREVAG
ncbi:NACHT domain-containing protein [Amycolatopsis pretoriensis]|uniref:NACHT domain-containing protein n=1 Tax=Amycolatopsis pretoriensis TaxID=218821 RepID=A0A1H5RGJ0_9PSEU|nr:NACHT domain-containing protein [Amycolatopsis pretoriensis]SEF37194.1 NACHT domain-containing protein [Amycolatopsis pretoriensis]